MDYFSSFRFETVMILVNLIQFNSALNDLRLLSSLSKDYVKMSFLSTSGLSQNERRHSYVFEPAYGSV